MGGAPDQTKRGAACPDQLFRMMLPSTVTAIRRGTVFEGEHGESRLSIGAERIDEGFVLAGEAQEQVGCRAWRRLGGAAGSCGRSRAAADVAHGCGRSEGKRERKGLRPGEPISSTNRPGSPPNRSSILAHGSRGVKDRWGRRRPGHNCKSDPRVAPGPDQRGGVGDRGSDCRKWRNRSSRRAGSGRFCTARGMKMALLWRFCSP